MFMDMLTVPTLDVSFFKQNGYLHLPALLSNELLERLRLAVDALCIEDAEHNDRAIVSSSSGESFVICVNSIVPKSQAVFIEVLASSWFQQIAREICGDDYFLVQDFTVVKTRGDESPVNWHQDVVSRQPGKAVMVGLYLDASDEQNGALRIVPQSHRSNAGICELERMPYRSLAMQPGDVLIHDLMLAHSSGVLSTQEKRRVVYFELMSATHALTEGIYSPEFVAQRSRVIPATIRVVNAKGLKVKAAAYCFAPPTSMHMMQGN
jgi:hypothetical protein